MQWQGLKDDRRITHTTYCPSVDPEDEKRQYGSGFTAKLGGFGVVVVVDTGTDTVCGRYGVHRSRRWWKRPAAAASTLHQGLLEFPSTESAHTRRRDRFASFSAGFFTAACQSLSKEPLSCWKHVVDPMDSLRPLYIGAFGAAWIGVQPPIYSRFRYMQATRADDSILRDQRPAKLTSMQRFRIHSLSADHCTQCTVTVYWLKEDIWKSKELVRTYKNDLSSSTR